MFHSKGLKAACLSATTAAALLGLISGAEASSHREAPVISSDPAIDPTDLYAFVSPEDPDRVVLVMNYFPGMLPQAGPNWYFMDTAARYNMWVDSDGDSFADGGIRFRFRTQVLNDNTFLNFTGPVSSLSDATYNRRQTFDVYWVDDVGVETKLNTNSLKVPPAYPGDFTTPDYESLAEDATYTLPNGWRVFAGPRDDPFYVDLGAIFDTVQLRSPGYDGLEGLNCFTMAMEIPIEDLTTDGLDKLTTSEEVLGFWTTSTRSRTTTMNANGTRTYSGPQVQVGRLGNPLVNEAVVALEQKDAFNAIRPDQDGTTVDLSRITDPELAAAINLLYGPSGLIAPLGADCVTSGRTDLVTIFLLGVPGLNQPAGIVASEMLRLNVAIEPVAMGDAGFSTYGVIGGDVGGFPNGRRLEDDVVDIAEQVVCGLLADDFGVVGTEPVIASLLGDSVNSNDVALMTTFPFVATPHSGFDWGM